MSKDKPSASNPRKQRLAEALRANLQRRKQAARQRKQQSGAKTDGSHQD
jgi:hypothetical protein